MHGKPVRRSDVFTRDLALERDLARELRGEVRFDAPTRGRYATDASIYQIMPLGVVFPKSADDIATTLDAARRHGRSVVMRGGGTSQNGQPIGEGLVVDCSRHFGAVLSRDGETITVEPGVVLERLNARLKTDGLFFPVEPSTASRCTIGGMTGNNSCGARSIRYGKMVDNVVAVEGLLAGGEGFRFAGAVSNGPGAAALAIAAREREEIAARYPKVQRRVGGYNLDSLVLPEPNLAHLMVGSEGTLAAFTAIMLKLSRLPAHRVMGVCHFPSFRAAMETTRHLVALGPVAVELVDNNVLTLGADIPLFVKTLSAITRGRPDCLLLVEFAGEDRASLDLDLNRLDQCMADHGFPDAMVPVTDAGRQRQVWEVREACLNIMMSMKGDGKPVSFIEDCAVPLNRLADYTDAVTAVFEKHGTRGTWYAHASVGCLHVRPILDMKTAEGVAAMRSIAEETAELVKRFEGSYSGEHGDGISRSEFIEPLFGARLARAFEEVKDAFDPDNRLNPGKIVRPLRFDDRRLLRYPEGYAAALSGPALDWSREGSFAAAVEMCNNNGTCRKLAGGTMCPSYRATREEEHSTRGRANTLRLAISGELGPNALTSPEVMAALDLCVGCKSCKRECPTGVDMARMKTEVLAQRVAVHGLSIRDRIVAYLPRWAPLAAKVGPLLNAVGRFAPARALLARVAGIAVERSLPTWEAPWHEPQASRPEDVQGDGLDLVLFADTFDRHFEPRVLEAARAVLAAAGYRLHHVAPDGRALCCGRTYLATGLVDRARGEARRTAGSLLPYVARGARIVGVEPSCLLTLRDEYLALIPAEMAEPLAKAVLMVEEALLADLDAGRVSLRLDHQGGRTVHIHGHCHQKAAGAFDAVTSLLARVPGLGVNAIESSCCGMAGAFGYYDAHIAVSKAMGELSLLPAVRTAGPDDWIVADGTSCRHQILDGAGREARHVMEIIAACLTEASP